jgi:short-subunit dehydrogenase
MTIVLVTGASSGFGAATAAAFAARGMHVVGTSRSGAATAADVEMVALDVDDDASVGWCIDDIERRHGRIDIVVNNAGRALLGAAEETTAAEARALFETNVFGVMRVTNAVLPRMRARGAGAIVNVGSLSGFIGVPFHGVYAATKHALAGYTEALRLEVEAFGIRVVLVEPAAHATHIAMPRSERLLAHYDDARERVGAIIRGQIEGGGDPRRVADAIVCAAMSERAPWRVRVGAKAALGNVARRLLTTRMFERFLRREFGRAPRALIAAAR